MTELVDLNSRRQPVVYTVTIAHHYDGTLEFCIEDVADDDRSRESVLYAFRRISGAADEIERLREELQWAIKDCDAKTNHESIKRELLEALEGK